MKVLIIEDNMTKLDNAIRIVKENSESAEIVHISNYNEAYRACYTKAQIDKFNLIILDMEFYRARPFEGTNPIKHPFAGSMLLAHLAKKKCTVPTIIFSGEADYLKKYKSYLFIPFSEFCDRYDSHPLFIEGSPVSILYEKSIAASQQLLDDSSFIIGHAHNADELEVILKTHLDMKQKAG